MKKERKKSKKNICDLSDLKMVLKFTNIFFLNLRNIITQFLILIWKLKSRTLFYSI